MGHGVDGRETPAANLTADSAAAVAMTLQALATPSRLLLLSQLRQGPATVGELTRAVAMEQSAVSHQLRLLRTMGLVAATRSGRNITYTLYDSHVSALLDEAVFHAEHLRLRPSEAARASAGRHLVGDSDDGQGLADDGEPVQDAVLVDNRRRSAAQPARGRARGRG